MVGKYTSYLNGIYNFELQLLYNICGRYTSYVNGIYNVADKY